MCISTPYYKKINDCESTVISVLSDWVILFIVVSGSVSACGWYNWSGKSITVLSVGRNSSVCVATRCGLNDYGSCRRGGGVNFRTRGALSWDPRSLLNNGYRVSFSRLKWPGRGIGHTPYLLLRFKKIREYLYCLSGPPHCVVEWNFLRGASGQ
jgi:hypothetical protein